METCPAKPVRLGTAKDQVAEALADSSVCRDYERAFTAATGLPFALRPPGDWQMPFRGQKNETGFCAILAQRSSACSACLRTQEELLKCAAHRSCTLSCPYGLVESAVPVRSGDRLIGFLRTGQVFQRKPSASQFRSIARKLRAQGVTALPELERAYFSTPVIRPARYRGMIELLSFFAGQLAAMSNEIVIRQRNREPVAVARAKEYIRAHRLEELSLKQVARAVNTSASYLCRLFKRTTGVNYSQYRARVRLEHAKQLLLNPNLRVGEIAYEVGFQSLTHFNRVFKKLIGQSPSEYRAGRRCA